MTGGGPGSTNVPYFVYQESIGGGFRYGSASAYAIVVVIFVDRHRDVRACGSCPGS